MAVNKNADDYANARMGIYFPGSSNGTLNDGDLTSQCVTLVKWFMSEMGTVPNPGQARGHAKDFGDTLVRQGHAYVVGAGERKRGDIVVWKGDGGVYGHIGVLCSGDNIFECNAGIAGTPSRIIKSGKESWRVWASRLSPLYANWRKGAPTFYRLRTYIENVTPAAPPKPAPDPNGDITMPLPNQDNYFGRMNKLFYQVRGRNMTRDEYNKNLVGKALLTAIEMISDADEADNATRDQEYGKAARERGWEAKANTADKASAEAKKNAELYNAAETKRVEAEQEIARLQAIIDTPAPEPEQPKETGFAKLLNFIFGGKK